MWVMGFCFLEFKTSMKTKNHSTAILFLIALTALIGFKAYRLASSEIRSLKPPRETVSLPNELTAAYQNIRFETSDNLSLAAWYAAPKNGKTLIFLHGYAGSRSQVLGEAELFRANGYGVFLYDARAHGESQGDEVSLGPKEVLDLRAAIAWLVKQPEVNAKEIGAYGFSMGAATLALEAAKDKRIAVMVFASSPSSQLDMSLDEGRYFGALQAFFQMTVLWAAGADGSHLNYGLAFEKLKGRPILIVQGLADKGVTPRQASKIFEQASEPKSFLLLPHSGHGEFLDNEDAALYKKTLLAFFDKNL
ncbi:MAG: alpha/beta fold hydrolase [Proteobacteria bacterium]|nr:MAG: alpha/beta fold hydrolase [Pseudomonadota bacterium]